MKTYVCTKICVLWVWENRIPSFEQWMARDYRLYLQLPKSRNKPNIHQLVHKQLGIPAQDPEKWKAFTAEVYSTGKTLTWLLLSEGSQVQEATYSVIPFIGNLWKDRLTETWAGRWFLSTRAGIKGGIQGDGNTPCLDSGGSYKAACVYWDW